MRSRIGISKRSGAGENVARPAIPKISHVKEIAARLVDSGWKSRLAADKIKHRVDDGWRVTRSNLTGVDDILLRGRREGADGGEIDGCCPRHVEKGLLHHSHGACHLALIAHHRRAVV